jgi:glucokinase
MAKTKITLGVDVGGTNTKMGFVDREGNILAEASMPTKGPDGQDHITAFLPRLYAEIDKLFAPIANETEWLGIGLGAPDSNYFRGTIENAHNFNWGGIIPIVDLIKKQYNLPTVITNDANAAALGEMIFGAARGMKDFIVITLGTGLGSGIVTNGELVYGYSGCAGELGHWTVNYEGRQCACGKRGCLETYVSVTGIRRTVSKLLADNIVHSELRKISQDDLTGEIITQAAFKGDKIALDAFEYTGQILGQKLADAVAFSSPEAIILFGGLANAQDLILQPTLQYMEKNMFHLFKGSCKLLISELLDRNAAVLGSSALIWHELEKSKPH